MVSTAIFLVHYEIVRLTNTVEQEAAHVLQLDMYSSAQAAGRGVRHQTNQWALLEREPAT